MTLKWGAATFFIRAETDHNVIFKIQVWFANYPNET